MSPRLRRWGPAIALALGILLVFLALGFALYAFANSRHTTRRLIHSNSERLTDEAKARRREYDQIRYAAYIFCRSEGRSPRACKKIASLIILPKTLSVRVLEAQLARIGEARVKALFIGPKGRKVLATPVGKQGPAGPRGPAGARGSKGSQGPRGAAGAKGQTGPAGPRGVKGLTGPVGPAGPAGPSGPAGIPSCPAGTTLKQETLRLWPTGSIVVWVCTK